LGLGYWSGSGPGQAWVLDLSQARVRVGLGSWIRVRLGSWIRVGLRSESGWGLGSESGSVPGQAWVLDPSRAQVRVRLGSWIRVGLGSESGSGPSKVRARVRLGSESGSVLVSLGSESAISAATCDRQLRSISVVVMDTCTAVVVRWQVLLGGCISSHWSQVHFYRRGCHPCLCHRAKVSPTQACNIKDNGELPCLPPLFFFLIHTCLPF
jgi:hypothetical protein